MFFFPVSLYLSVLPEDKGDDRSKFDLLYEEYKYSMFYVANDILRNYHDAEDAVHNSFLYLLANMDKIGEVPSPEVRYFVLSLTKWRAIDIYRKHTGKELLYDPFAFADLKSCNNIEELFETNRTRIIFDTIHELPEKLEEVLELHYAYDMKEKDIASYLKISNAAVYKRVERGKQKLEVMLVQKGVR